MSEDIPLALPTEQAYLASALQLLIDAAYVRDGTRIGYADIREYFGEGRISRSRWLYMLRGGSHLVKDSPLRAELAAFFDVAPRHLASDGRCELLDLLAPELPAITRHRLELVRAAASRASTGADDRGMSRVEEYLGDEIKLLDEHVRAHRPFMTGLRPADAEMPLDLAPPERTGLLAGKNILVTGVLSRSSMAFHIARLAQAEGANVVLSSFGRRMHLTQAMARQLPHHVPVIELDVADQAHLDQLVSGLRNHFDAVHGVVHSISGGDRGLMGGRFIEAEWREIAQAMEASAYSLKSLAVATRPLMPRGSSIVGITFDARFTWPLHDWMGVSKAAYESICRYLARYLGPDGIRCNLVSGGPTDSPATRAIPGYADVRSQLGEEFQRRAALGWDFDDPEPIARAVLVLLSDWLPATTGEILHVDGGVHATAF